jgi:modification methylase
LRQRFGGKSNDTSAKIFAEVGGGRVVDELARAVGLGSGRTLEYLRRVEKERPDLFALVDSRKKSIGAAYSELKRGQVLKEAQAKVRCLVHRPDVQLDDWFALAHQLREEHFALVLADPPYGLTEEDGEPRRVGTVATEARYGSWDKLTDAEAATRARFSAEAFFRVLKPGGVVYLFPGSRFFCIWAAELAQAGFEFPRPNFLVWEKANCAPSIGKAWWKSAAEWILCAVKAGPRVCNWQGEAEMRNVLRFPVVAHGRLHPTEKPVGLLERLILFSTQPGDVVLDPFAGSGSTGEAALRTRRESFLIEADAAFHALATERLARVEAELASSGIIGTPSAVKPEGAE